MSTTPVDILEAIRERAWLPEQIAKMTNRYALEDRPPPLEDVPDWIDYKIDKRAMAKGDSAMAAAYQKAKRRAA